MSAIHGGAYWAAIDGNVDRLKEVVRADVLDAWFPPAPGVVATLSRNLSAICNTSPEVEATHLTRWIAEWRGVPEESVLVGPGSSSLIYHALPRLLDRCRAAATLEPTYSEYPHLLEDRLKLRLCRVPTVPPPEDLLGTEAIVLVNPNSPTGTTLDARSLLENLDTAVKVWIDETYLDYAGVESMEPLAAERPNLIVVKSLSKTLALSGLRIGYLVAHPDLVRTLRAEAAPWPVGMPAQVAVRAALEDPVYYRQRYEETRSMVRDLAESLHAKPTSINCVLYTGVDANRIADELERESVFVRRLEDGRLRIAARPRPETWRMVKAFQKAVAAG